MDLHKDLWVVVIEFWRSICSQIALPTWAKLGPSWRASLGRGWLRARCELVLSTGPCSDQANLPMLGKLCRAKLGPSSFSTHWLPSSNQAWPVVGSHCVINRLPGLAQCWAKVFFNLPTLGLAWAKLVCHTLAAELWPSCTHCWKAFALPSCLLSRACWAKLGPSSLAMHWLPSLAQALPMFGAIVLPGLCQGVFCHLPTFGQACPSLFIPYWWNVGAVR